MNVMLEWAVNSVYTPGKAYGYGREDLYGYSDVEGSGAIDVIAIRRADGSLCCSPFHVKIGNGKKKKVYRKTAKSIPDDEKDKGVVKLRRVCSPETESRYLSMKLGPAGEAFFVQKLPRYTMIPTEFKDSIPSASSSSALIHSSNASEAPTKPDSIPMEVGGSDSLPPAAILETKGALLNAVDTVQLDVTQANEVPNQDMQRRYHHLYLSTGICLAITSAQRGSGSAGTPTALFRGQSLRCDGDLAGSADRVPAPLRRRSHQDRAAGSFA